MGWFSKKPTVGEAAEGLSTLGKTIYSLVKGKLPPDEDAKLQLELAKLDQQLMMGQMAINEAEARNQNWFVAGARPFILWICGVAILYNFVIAPFLYSFFSVYKIDFPLPQLDMGTLMSLTLGMLGISGLRTYEKLRGVNDRHN